MGKKFDKFKDVMGNIGYRAHVILNPLSEDRMWHGNAGLQIIQLLAYVGIAVGTPFIAMGCDASIGKSEKNDLLKTVEVLNNEFNANIEEKAGLNNFYSANCKLYKNNEENILSVFGSQDVEHKNGDITKEFVEVRFVIDENNAENLEQKINEKADYDRYAFDVVSNFGSSSTVNTDIDYNLFSRDAQKKSFALSIATYDALNEAVAKAYECEVNTRYEASSMSRSLANAYRFTKPESLTTSETHGWYVHFHKEFYSAGLLTTGISEITRDIEKDTATFYVDTLQSVDGRNFTMNKAKVVIKGAELSDDEVFKAFVDGKYDSFTEIERFGLTENSIVTTELSDSEIY